ncbi:MAG: hypothetical protein KF872_12595 [Chitinophagales bacterium]|nr:hypothetical protein [Chitinophagales bacterium]
MEREILSIKRKALRINLEPTIYGTFAEIGAGQEVARTFFQAGGASGTVAKTMSAYDMSFSDSIYGEEESGRYVSESRLRKMLDHEYALLEERLCSEKYAGRRFFAFADTCSTINFLKNNDPHAWIGLRFQLKPGGPTNDIKLHVRLKGTDNVLQQKVIGTLGVNLIFACYWYHENMDNFLDSLYDGLSPEQVELDMIRVKGPDFDIDNRLLALMLVRKHFTDATIFGADREVYQPKDVLYKKNILCLRGRFRPVTRVNEDMLRCGIESFSKVACCGSSELAVLAEITLANLESDENYSDRDFLDRAEILCSLGHTVMVSNCHKHDVLVRYLNRCRPKSIGIIIGVMNMLELFKEKHYTNPSRELLAYFGEIFLENTTMLMYPYQPHADKPVITSDNLHIPEALGPLFRYLKHSGFIVDLKNYDPHVLSIFSTKVISMIKQGESGWEEMVPDKVADIIKENCLFEYPCEV